MLIFKNLKRLPLGNIKYFSSKINTEKFGLSQTSSENDRQIGKNEKFKENFRTREERLNREDFLKQEITKNPEFFKAFPHLADIVKSVNEVETNDLQKHINEKYTKEKPVYKNDNYFESLL
jgi:hypothetical protein